MSARETVLDAVRAALTARAAPPAFTAAHRRRGELTAEATVERFLSRLDDYGVGVAVVEDEADIADAVAGRLQARGVHALVTPPDLPAAWRPEGVEIVADCAPDPRSLASAPSSLTRCALAIAETGSIVLDGGAAQGRRALTLLPDHHICVVFASQLVQTVPEAIGALHAAARTGRPLTLFSGPSATADIEFDRVVGVHGPRRLDVVFVRRCATAPGVGAPV